VAVEAVQSPGALVEEEVAHRCWALVEVEALRWLALVAEEARHCLASVEGAGSIGLASGEAVEYQTWVAAVVEEVHRLKGVAA
jgi:hypothetical protein